MAMGNLFIFALQHQYGALVVTKVTTVRKLLSVVGSVVIFGHRMALAQWVGVGVVCFSNQLSGYIITALGLQEKADDKKKN